MPPMMGPTTGIQAYAQSGRSFAGDRKEGVREARAQIARGVDRVAGRAAERQPDAEHQHAHEQGLQAAAEDEREVDVARSRQVLRVGGDREDPEHQDCRADHLGHDVGGRALDGRRRAEHAELGRRVRGLSPVGQIGEPDEHRADERADHLGRDVAGDLAPRKAADRGQTNRHRGVEVRAADRDRPRRRPSRRPRPSRS